MKIMVMTRSGYISSSLDDMTLGTTDALSKQSLLSTVTLHNFLEVDEVRVLSHQRVESNSSLKKEI